MQNVASLINKSNIKKIRNNQHTEPPKFDCTNKTNSPPQKGGLIWVCSVVK